jgi:threonine aldolase
LSKIRAKLAEAEHDLSQLQGAYAKAKKLNLHLKQVKLNLEHDCNGIFSKTPILQSKKYLLEEKVVEV